MLLMKKRVVLMLCTHKVIFTFLHGGVQTIAFSMSVCLSVKFQNHTPNVIVFCTCCLCCGHDSVILWRHCSILCTSTFVDDVIFSHNGAYLVHSEAYGQGMLVSRRQCGDWHSTSSPPLSALTPADWHPSAVSLVIRNGVGCGCEQCTAGGEQSLLS